MDIKSKTTGPVLDALGIWAEVWARIDKEEAEKIAREKAEWDALPEDEKTRVITLREQEKLELERRQAEKERNELIREWQNRGVTPRFYDATWENWKAETQEQKKVLEKVKQAWKKNLFIVGGNGAGKTHLAMCLTKDGATYCFAPELFRAVRENLNIEQETIDEYGTCKLLILDEAGRQKGTDFERNLLFEIIDKRWNNMLPTTIIGNIDKREFADLYGSAIVDRLRPETIEFAWKSKRQREDSEHGGE
jgi:DNA replication protein DnaC